MDTKIYEWPNDDPWVVSVGGTDLITMSPGGSWASETTWSDSGGGISTDGIAIPSWQQLPGVINSSNAGSKTLRNGPDVAANADFTFYVCANQTTCTANVWGGTSFAAPMWAAYVALANEKAANNNQSPVGFLNPTIYQQNLDSNTYSNNFHDINNAFSGRYSAVTGYDLVTGWGSPNGEALINALTSLSSSPTNTFTVSVNPTSASISRGQSGSAAVTTQVSGNLNSAITLSASGQPSGVTLNLRPASIAGSDTSTLKINVAKSASIGFYPITISGAAGGSTETATFTLQVTR